MPEHVEFYRRCGCGNPNAYWQETFTTTGHTAIRITCDQCEPIHEPIEPIPLPPGWKWINNQGGTTA